MWGVRGGERQVGVRGLEGMGERFGTFSMESYVL